MKVDFTHVLSHLGKCTPFVFSCKNCAYLASWSQREANARPRCSLTGVFEQLVLALSVRSNSNGGIALAWEINIIYKRKRIEGKIIENEIQNVKES